MDKKSEKHKKLTLKLKTYCHAYKNYQYTMHTFENPIENKWIGKKNTFKTITFNHQIQLGLNRKYFVIYKLLENMALFILLDYNALLKNNGNGRHPLSMWVAQVVVAADKTPEVWPYTSAWMTQATVAIDK